jgi:uncharacterized protein (DUF58 family)
VIYPTRRAVAVAAAGVPVAIGASLLGPTLWLVGVAWLFLATGLMLADAMLGASRGGLKLIPDLPTHLPIGGRGEARIAASFGRGIVPGSAEFALDTDQRLEAQPKRVFVSLSAREGTIGFALKPKRRGVAVLERLWARWQGPFGLVWKQRIEEIDAKVAITPNVAAVKEDVLKLFDRNILFGQHMRPQLGDSAEFHALTEFRTGMDRRAIDWKHSAKHAALLAREYRTESNQHIVVALDTGRLMCEPILGQPKLDRALHAALLLAYAALKLGDRVGLFAFDARPRLSSGTVAGAGAFPLLQRLAAGVDYSSEETNYTLGLTQLSGELERRSLVVIFTDFADATSAELMIENMERLLRRHLVLFVVFRDEELENLRAREPLNADDVSRAVIADGLLRERDVVIGRLRRLGVRIVDASAEHVGMQLLNAYLDLKKRDLL